MFVSGVSCMIYLPIKKTKCPVIGGENQVYIRDPKLSPIFGGSKNLCASIDKSGVLGNLKFFSKDLIEYPSTLNHISKLTP